MSLNTIKMQLVHNDHSAPSPEISQTVTVNVQAPATSVSVDLTPLQNSENNVTYLAIVVIVLLIIVLIVPAAAMRIRPMK